MAFIRDPKGGKRDEQLRQTGGALPSSVAPAAVPAAQQTGKTPESRRQSGTFSGIQKYLKANVGQGQQLAKRITEEGIKPQAIGVTEDVQRAGTQFKQQVQEAGKKYFGEEDKPLITKIQTQGFTPQQLSEQEKQRAQKLIAEAKYEGPEELESSELQSRALQAQQRAQALSTEEGRSAELQRFVSAKSPSYKQGQKSLDQLLLQTSPEAQAQFYHTKEDVSKNLPSWLSQLTTETKSAAQAEKERIEGLRQKLYAALRPPTPIPTPVSQPSTPFVPDLPPSVVTPVATPPVETPPPAPEGFQGIPTPAGSVEQPGVVPEQVTEVAPQPKPRKVEVDNMAKIQEAMTSAPQSQYNVSLQDPDTGQLLFEGPISQLNAIRRFVDPVDYFKQLAEDKNRSPYIQPKKGAPSEQEIRNQYIVDQQNQLVDKVQNELVGLPQADRENILNSIKMNLADFITSGNIPTGEDILNNPGIVAFTNSLIENAKNQQASLPVGEQVTEIPETGPITTPAEPTAPVVPKFNELPIEQRTNIIQQNIQEVLQSLQEQLNQLSPEDRKNLEKQITDYVSNSYYSSNQPYSPDSKINQLTPNLSAQIQVGISKQQEKTQREQSLSQRSTQLQDILTQEAQQTAQLQEQEKYVQQVQDALNAHLTKPVNRFNKADFDNIKAQIEAELSSAKSNLDTLKNQSSLIAQNKENLLKDINTIQKDYDVSGIKPKEFEQVKEQLYKSPELLAPIQDSFTEKTITAISNSDAFLNELRKTLIDSGKMTSSTTADQVKQYLNTNLSREEAEKTVSKIFDKVLQNPLTADFQTKELLKEAVGYGLVKVEDGKLRFIKQGEKPTEQFDPTKQSGYQSIVDSVQKRAETAKQEQQSTVKAYGDFLTKGYPTNPDGSYKSGEYEPSKALYEFLTGKKLPEGQRPPKVNLFGVNPNDFIKKAEINDESLFYNVMRPDELQALKEYSDIFGVENKYQPTDPSIVGNYQHGVYFDMDGFVKRLTSKYADMTLQPYVDFDKRLKSSTSSTPDAFRIDVPNIQQASSTRGVINDYFNNYFSSPQTSSGNKNSNVFKTNQSLLTAFADLPSNILKEAGKEWAIQPAGMDKIVNDLYQDVYGKIHKIESQLGLPKTSITDIYKKIYGTSDAYGAASKILSQAGYTDRDISKMFEHNNNYGHTLGTKNENYPRWMGPFYAALYKARSTAINQLQGKLDLYASLNMSKLSPARSNPLYKTLNMYPNLSLGGKRTLSGSSIGLTGLNLQQPQPDVVAVAASKPGVKANLL